MPRLRCVSRTSDTSRCPRRRIHAERIVPTRIRSLTARPSFPPRLSCLSAEHRDSVALVRVPPQTREDAGAGVAERAPSRAREAQAQFPVPRKRRVAELAEKGSEWIEALWPKMGWAVKHTPRATSDEKTAKSCAETRQGVAGQEDLRKPVARGVARRERGETTPPTPPPMRRRRRGRGGGRGARAPGRAPQGGAFDRDPRGFDRQERGSGEGARGGGEGHRRARRRGRDVRGGPARRGPGAMASRRRRRTPRTPSARSEPPSPRSRRAARPWRRARGSARSARLAREVCEVHEAAAASESEALDASAGVAVRVATLRMKATKRAAAAMATTAAAEAAGANKSRPGLDPPPQTAVAPDAPDAREAAPEEEYVPEPADGEEEYVPEHVPEAGAAPDLEQLLAAGARPGGALAGARGAPRGPARDVRGAAQGCGRDVSGGRTCERTRGRRCATPSPSSLSRVNCTK